MLRCSATRAMTRTLHEPWPRPKRPPSARDPPSQSAAPPENRRVNQPETVSQLKTLVWMRPLCEMFAPRTSSILPLHDHGAGRTSFLNQGALRLMRRREAAQQVLQSLQSAVWHTKLPSAAGPAVPDNCPSRHPGSKRVTAERTREAWHTVQLYWVRPPPPERQLAAGPSRTAVRAACGASCQARRQTSIRHGAAGCGIGLLQSSPLRDARWGTQTLTAVRAAAALRAHSQGGYLGECIRGERTALRQAVLPNGTRPS